jgi:hypothetical protein
MWFGIPSRMRKYLYHSASYVKLVNDFTHHITKFLIADWISSQTWHRFIVRGHEYSKYSFLKLKDGHKVFGTPPKQRWPLYFRPLSLCDCFAQDLRNWRPPFLLEHSPWEPWTAMKSPRPLLAREAIAGLLCKILVSVQSSVFVFYDCWTNCHKLDGLKQYTFVCL